MIANILIAQFTASKPYFADAVTVNPGMASVWFSYGCAQLYTDDFAAATFSFRRCVLLDRENAEAWSNMAAAHMRLGDECVFVFVLLLCVDLHSIV